MPEETLPGRFSILFELNFIPTTSNYRLYLRLYNNFHYEYKTASVIGGIAPADPNILRRQDRQV